jgi:hypothetical protein
VSHTRNANSAQERSAPSDGAPQLRIITAIVIVGGSVVLWTAIPAGWVWLGHHLARDQATAYGIALVGAIPTMALWGWLLYRVQLAHSRVAPDGEPTPQRSGWLKSLSAEREPRETTLLESSLVLSALVAGIAFALWLVLGPASPWPHW